MFTKVVKICRKGGNIVQGCDVYIGRACYRGGWKLDKSKWHNPFKVGTDGDINEVLKKYKSYVLSNETLLENLDEIKGKTLGCWCKPTPCHGDILVELVTERMEEEMVNVDVEEFNSLVKNQKDLVKLQNAMISIHTSIERLLDPVITPVIISKLKLPTNASELNDFIYHYDSMFQRKSCKYENKINVVALNYLTNKMIQIPLNPKYTVSSFRFPYSPGVFNIAYKSDQLINDSLLYYGLQVMESLQNSF